jgi:hypothetical protein
MILSIFSSLSSNLETLVSRLAACVIFIPAISPIGPKLKGCGRSGILSSCGGCLLDGESKPSPSCLCEDIGDSASGS